MRHPPPQPWGHLTPQGPTPAGPGPASSAPPGRPEAAPGGAALPQPGPVRGRAGSGSAAPAGRAWRAPWRRAVRLPALPGRGEAPVRRVSKLSKAPSKEQESCPSQTPCQASQQRNRDIKKGTEGAETGCSSLAGLSGMGNRQWVGELE
ncbi:PREDICTED: basic proline-rich protein-like [Calidris pugnax]|uniref:basic proline-rich protein-like n=1 Tax=Calidris pugnax TaxID=198806 RepID=UPI00071C973A|nr:PREDICTED: basic proline-rich protein-like [Calidris pugnax]